jgi:hypothetical protein
MKSCFNPSSCNICVKHAECATYQSKKKYLDNNFYENKIRNMAEWLNPEMP